MAIAGIARAGGRPTAGCSSTHTGCPGARGELTEAAPTRASPRLRVFEKLAPKLRPEASPDPSPRAPRRRIRRRDLKGVNFPLARLMLQRRLDRAGRLRGARLGRFSGRGSLLCPGGQPSDPRKRRGRPCGAARALPASARSWKLGKPARGSGAARAELDAARAGAARRAPGDGHARERDGPSVVSTTMVAPGPAYDSGGGGAVRL